MKLTKNTDFRIAKGLLKDIFAKTEPLDSDKWIQFIENHSNYFVWNEDTEEGKKTLENINEISEDFKERVLASLNKTSSYAEYDYKNQRYDIFTRLLKTKFWQSMERNGA